MTRTKTHPALSAQCQGLRTTEAWDHAHQNPFDPANPRFYDLRTADAQDGTDQDSSSTVGISATVG